MDEKLKKEEKCTSKVVAFVAVMSVFFFLTIGTDQSLANYLTIFAVKSELLATK